ncbi:hypothetical protein [Actinomycetospora cinnamomea]|uniref:Uncharacterized protein n=1 Tax=Actinomycetospora cinnamomea TaxID=663609 RepID=A0A2U1FR05_9PSEU|nr:hypothetical protein [Actinomycetospora cinnamomea]PVZ14542.1 hypothetical protein C8D89_101407 [Actinomycetospora cinnamomea]
MSQPGRPRAAGRTSAPLRVSSERLTDEEARAAAATPPAPAEPTGPVRTVPPPHPAASPPAATAVAAPVVARPSLPVVAPRPRRRLADLWRLLFSRRRAGRHRPETTPPQGWSMFAPQRRRPPGRRWGRRI